MQNVDTLQNVDLITPLQAVVNCDFNQSMVNLYELSSIDQIFGNIRGKRIAVVVDISDANAGFGRLTAFQESLVVSTSNKCSICLSVSN